MRTRHKLGMHEECCAEMRGNMLTGKVAVITGASRGIGRATAIELASKRSLRDRQLQRIGGGST